jgi:beta-alanine degradation protein BauB
MMKMENSPDAMTAASNVYKLLFENEKVRVLEVYFKSGDFAKMHHHPDHVVYVQKGGKIMLNSEGKNDALDLPAGSAVFLKAQDHEATNIGESDLDLIVVELKK